MNKNTTLKTAIILGIPHQLKAFAYSVRDMAHLHECANAVSGDSTPYEFTSARELLRHYSAEEVAEEIADGDPFIAQIHALGEEHGIDAPLYRADHVNTGYTAVKIDEEEALLAAIGHDLHDLVTFASEDEAREALAAGRVTRTGHQEYAAQDALRKLLGEAGE